MAGTRVPRFSVTVVNSGVWCYSDTTSTGGLVLAGSFAGGVTVVNNGNIIGMGGGASQAGGMALQITTSDTVAVTNNSGAFIAGGGGGGGGSYTYTSVGSPERLLAIQAVAVRGRLVPLVTHHQGQAAMPTAVSIPIALLAMDVVGQPILLTHEVQFYQGVTATVVAVVVGHSQGRLLLFTLAALAQGDCR